MEITGTNTSENVLNMSEAFAFEKHNFFRKMP